MSVEFIVTWFCKYSMTIKNSYQGLVIFIVFDNIGMIIHVIPYKFN